MSERIYGRCTITSPGTTRGTGSSPLLRRFRILAAVAVVAAVLAAPSSSATLASSPKLVHVSLQLDFIKNIQFSGILLGLQKGYYRAAGIDLTVNAQSPTSDPVALVASGADMIGMQSGDVLIQAHEKGIPVKAFAADLQINPSGWLVLKSSGIKSYADFKGKTLGMPAAYFNQAPLVLSLEGLRQNQVHLRSVGFDVSVLVNHEVDVFNAFATNQPISLDLKGIPNHFFRWYDTGYVYYTDAFFTTDKVLKSNPGLLRRFVRATQRGWAYVFAHPKQAVNFIVSTYGQGLLDKTQQTRELAALKPLMETQQTAAHGFGYMNARQWQKGINLFAKFHLIRRNFPASALFAPGFVTRH